MPEKMIDFKCKDCGKDLGGIHLAKGKAEIKSAPINMEVTCACGGVSFVEIGAGTIPARTVSLGRIGINTKVIETGS